MKTAPGSAYTTVLGDVADAGAGTLLQYPVFSFDPTGGHVTHMVERRDYWSRAALSARIVKWLNNHRGNQFPPDTDPSIADRILKWLALRGLARKEGGSWKPTPPMARPADVIKVDEE